MHAPPSMHLLTNLKTGAFILIPLLAVVAIGSASAASASQLNAAERDRLRYRLENLSNELELLIRNRRSDLSDLKRQERDMVASKVFERVPVGDELASLQTQLRSILEERGDRQSPSAVKALAVRITRREALPPPIPAEIHSDQKFRLTPEQISEKLSLSIEFSGRGTAVRARLASLLGLGNTLPTVRWIRLPHGSSGIQRLAGGSDRWKIDGETYRFRELRFPRIKPRNPIELLPAATQAGDPNFAREEPLLWEFVKKIRELAPRAQPFYEERGRFLLNDARISFVIALERGRYR